MLMTGYLHVEGEVSGVISENVGVIEQHRDEIPLLGLRHKVAMEQDRFQMGNRVHHPIEVDKLFDRSSPLLYKALCQREVLTCRFRWYQPSPAGDGTLQHAYTVVLNGAYAVAIEPEMTSPDSAWSSTSIAPDTFLYKERVAFRYREITWTHEPAGIEFQDYWRQENT